MKELRKRCLRRPLPFLLCIVFFIMISMIFGSSVVTSNIHDRNERLSIMNWINLPSLYVFTSQAVTTPLPPPFPVWPPTQISTVIKNVDSMLAPFLANLIQIREQHLRKLQNQTWSVAPPTTQFVDANSNSFINTLKTIKEVQTIWISITLASLLTKLPWIGYHYGGNNCDLLERKSNYGNNATFIMRKGYGMLYFNDTCRTDNETLTKNIPFPRNILEIAISPLMSSNFTTGPYVILTYLHVMKNAAVTQNGDAFLGTYKYLPQRCEPEYTLFKPFDEILLPLHDEVFTLAQFWGEGYFHFMNEQLPRLAAWLPFLKKYPNIKLHFNSQQQFLTPTLQLLGLNADRIIVNNIRAKLLYMPAGTPCGAPAYFNSKLLSLRLQENIPKIPYTPEPSNIPQSSIPTNNQEPNTFQQSVQQTTVITKVYPTRQNISKKVQGNLQKQNIPTQQGTNLRTTSFSENRSTSLKASAMGMHDISLTRDTIVVIKRSEKRYFLHHDDIFREIKRFADIKGLVVELFADKPIPSHTATVQMFHRAVAIVAPHGAGLSNMLYSQPGTVIVEGLCYHQEWANLCYRNLAKLLGHRYFGVLLTEQCTETKAEDIMPHLKNILNRLLN